LPVVRRQGSIILISQHHFERPPNYPKAGHHAKHFRDVVLGAARQGTVVSEFEVELLVGDNVQDGAGLRAGYEHDG
jgi:hypothetical protein